MAYALPLVLSFIFNCFGFVMFNDFKHTHVDINLPVMSTILFAVSVAVILREMNLYPYEFRRLHWLVMYLYEFFACGILIETCVNYVWASVELLIVSFPPSVGDGIISIAEILAPNFKRTLDALIALNLWLHDPDFLYFFSLLASTALFVTVLHATRNIDLIILLRCGPKIFFQHVTNRCKGVAKDVVASFISSMPLPKSNSRFTSKRRNRRLCH